MKSRRMAGLVLAALLTAVAAGCSAGPSGAEDLRLSDASAAAEEDTASPLPAPSSDCTDPTSSYPPIDPAVDGFPDSVQTIVDRGHLNVGVSADTYLMGFRNPLTGAIEGFDIDVLHEVSTALFGDPDRLQFTVLSSDERVEALRSGEVDLVARAMTITCERWDEIAFSTEYFHAGQKILVPTDSRITTLRNLGGERVCAPEGTTTLAKLDEFPDVVAVPAPSHTACLTLFQQGEVDAITGDDTILAGLAAQDPYAKVVGEAISEEPYGIGVNASNTGLVQVVNGVLEQMKADGRWQASYDRWFSSLGPATPPVAVFGRTP